jgi:hypothetical protein
MRGLLRVESSAGRQCSDHGTRTTSPSPFRSASQLARGHHLPSWRPEPPFLPGRIAEPVDAPGARSGLPILQPSQAGAEQREGQGTAGGARGWAAQEPPPERCPELVGVVLATVRELAAKVEPYLPRRRHQDLESHATRAAAPARSLQVPARRLPRPSTNAAVAHTASLGPDQDDRRLPGTPVTHTNIRTPQGAIRPNALKQPSLGVLQMHEDPVERFK